MNEDQSRARRAARRGGERYSPELPYRPLVPPPSVEDRDACAIYASVRRDATPSRAPVARAIASLQKMLHRAGNVDGEGDGCGLMIDIPRKIWAEEVRAAAMIPRSPSTTPSRSPMSSSSARRTSRGCSTTPGRSSAAAASASSPSGPARSTRRRWGRPRARRSRTSGSSAGCSPTPGNATASSSTLLIELERRLDVHVASLSATTCVYKVMGAPKVLGDYYPDLRDERAETIGCPRPQPLLDQHLALVQAGAAVLGPRPQRRDQHDRAAPPGGAHAGRADPARLLGLAGPQPHHRPPGPPARAQPRRGDGDGGAAGRQRDPHPARASATASTCICARRWGRSRRARWR